MRSFIGALMVAVLVLVGTSTAADVDGKKLVGKWEDQTAKKGVTRTLEFTADGKINVSVEVDGKSSKIEGTYKVEGDKITMTAKVMDMEVTQSVTISKLTDDELVGTSDSTKETKTYKRVKAK